jgi:hypothetical protein
MFTPLARQALDAYEELVNHFSMPLPVPKPQVYIHIDMLYMSLEEVVLQPCTDDQQPSLQSRSKAGKGPSYALAIDFTLGDRDPRANALEQHKLMQT